MKNDYGIINDDNRIMFISEPSILWSSYPNAYGHLEFLIRIVKPCSMFS